MAGAGTMPAVQCNKAAFAPRNAAVRLVPPGDRLPVADTGTAVAAASAVVPAGDTPVAVPASAAVHGPVIENDTAVYEFKTTIGTKG